jgi:hypothetical protein
MAIATSAPDDRPAYRRDFLMCMAAPVGYVARFSYRKRWYDPNIFDIPQPSGFPALLTFCERNGSRDQRFTMIPFRFATIIGFEPDEIVRKHLATEDTHIAVCFRLERFVHVSPNTIEAFETNWTDTVSGIHEGNPNGNPERYVFLAPIPDESGLVSPDTSWCALSQRLSDAPSLAQSSFVRFVGVFHRPWWLIRKRTPLQQSTFLDTPAYRIRCQRQYELEMVHYLRQESAHPPSCLVPRVSSKVLVLTAPSRQNVGHQSKAVMMLTSERVYRDEVTSITLEDPNDQAGLIPRVNLLIVLKAPAWLLFIVVLLLSLGAFSTGISSDFIKEIFPEENFVAQHANTFVYLVKAMGTLLVGVGAYLGFEKTPK